MTWNMINLKYMVIKLFSGYYPDYVTFCITECHIWIWKRKENEKCIFFNGKPISWIACRLKNSSGTLHVNESFRILRDIISWRHNLYPFAFTDKSAILLVFVPACNLYQEKSIRHIAKYSSTDSTLLEFDDGSGCSDSPLDQMLNVC